MIDTNADTEIYCDDNLYILNKKYTSIMVLDGYFKRENRHKIHYIYKLNGEMSRSPNFLQSL